jgi:hypothetical protein
VSNFAQDDVRFWEWAERKDNGNDNSRSLRDDKQKSDNSDGNGGMVSGFDGELIVSVVC